MFTDDHLCSISVPEGPMRMTERLVQQIRAIKDELGDNDDDEDDIVALERKMQSVGMPANVWKHAQRELRYFSCRSLFAVTNSVDLS
jgi:ATP-dependent Lon protease